MARNTSTLTVKIVSDASSAAKGFQDAETRVERFQRGMGRAAGVAAGVGAAIVGIGTMAVDSASRLQQAGGAVESVFGAQAATVKRFAEDAAQSVGLANAEYGELASVLGSQLKNMGTGAEELAPATDKLITLGADLAATFGGTTADAVGALSSLLRGERDPIERYGVSIKQADIDARLAALGMGELEGEAKKAAEAQATMALLTEQTSGALGAFTRESDTAAGQTQRAKAEFENATAALGTALLPAVTVMAEKLAVFAGFVQRNADVVVPLVAILGAMAAVIWLVNIAMYANPIGLIIAGVVGLIGVLVIAYQRFESFRNVVDTIGRFLGRVFQPFIEIVTDLWNRITRAGSAWDVFKALALAAINVVLAPLRTLWNIIRSIGEGIGKVGSWVGGLFSAPAVAGGGAPMAAAGVFAAPQDGAQWAPVRGAAMSTLAGGTSPSSGQGSGAPAISITVNGALDPQAVADQIAGCCAAATSTWA
jgi:hypothetical protein